MDRAGQVQQVGGKRTRARRSVARVVDAQPCLTTAVLECSVDPYVQRIVKGVARDSALPRVRDVIECRWGHAEVAVLDLELDFNAVPRDTTNLDCGAHCRGRSRVCWRTSCWGRG